MARWWMALALFAALGASACGGPCRVDEACGRGTYCVMGSCQQCRTANDCSSSERCVRGRCE